MPFWSRKKTNVPTGKELKRGVTQVPFENFLAGLIDSGKNYLIKLNRIGTDAAGEISGMIPVSTITPSTFTDVINEKHGGGSYELRFMDHDQGDALIMRKDDPNRPVMYLINIAGEPKGKKKEKEKDKSFDFGDLTGIVQAIFKPEVMTAFASLWNALTGQSNKQPDPAAMMQQITQTLVQLKQLAPDPEMPNPIAMIDSLLGVIQKMADQMKPPPTMQGAGGFWESIGRSLAPAIGGALSGVGGAPQLTQGQQVHGSPGLSGTGAAAQTGTAQDNESINPLRVLRDMVANRMNPEDVAAYAVEAIDTYIKFGSGNVPPQYSGLLERPGIAIDFLLSFVPNVDPAYRQQVKDAGIRYVEAWKEQNQPVEDQDATHFTPPTDTEQPPAPEDQGNSTGEPDDDEDAAPVGAKH